MLVVVLAGGGTTGQVRSIYLARQVLLRRYGAGTTSVVLRTSTTAVPVYAHFLYWYDAPRRVWDAYAYCCIWNHIFGDFRFLAGILRTCCVFFTAVLFSFFRAVPHR